MIWLFLLLLLRTRTAERGMDHVIRYLLAIVSEMLRRFGLFLFLFPLLTSFAALAALLITSAARLSKRELFYTLLHRADVVLQ